MRPSRSKFDTSDGQTRSLAYVSISELTPDPRNPRVHDRAQLQAIARSIETFGFNAPILIDKTNKILAGHGRFEAAKLLALANVPVIRLEHLSDAQAHAYMLADNQLTDRSSWNDDELAVHLKELSELALDFDIEAIGFEAPEIDFRIQSLDNQGDTDPADEFTPTYEAAVSQLGDLWLLGEHRVYCGDASDPFAYKTALGSIKATMVFTDPPYNVKIDGHASGNGSVKHREFAMASGEMTEEEFTGFLTRILGQICTHTSRGALLYVCMDWRHLAELLAAARTSNCNLLNICVWVKSNGGMGSLYRSRHELISVFKNGKGSHRNNVQLGRFGRNRTNVWNYPGANSFSRKGQERSIDLHPTVKPIALVGDAILDSTRRGDLVLDPFLGSGTAVLGAERTGRRCSGIEIDPLYVDTTIARWERLTGRQARHTSGQTFAEVKEDRRQGI